MFSVTITADTLEDFAEWLAHTNAQFARLAASKNEISSPTPSIQLDEKVVKAALTKAKKDAKAGAAEPAAEPVEEPATETAPEAEATPPALEYGDVSAAVLALVKAKGRDAAVAVLSEFGVPHAKELQPGQWAEALKALTDALDQEA
jgi:hypothetical protein